MNIKQYMNSKQYGNYKKNKCFNLIYEPYDVIDKETGKLKDIKVRILGNLFIYRNTCKYKIIYKNQIIKRKTQKEYFKEVIDNYNNKDKIKIKLVILDNYLDISHLFNGCTFLKSIVELPKKETLNDGSESNNINNISSEIEPKKSSTENNDSSSISNFYNESSSHSGIQKQNPMNNNLINVNKIPKERNLFYEKLYITNAYSIFNRCLSLEILPDISKWIPFNIYNMSFMFCSCKNLMTLPDISVWNTSNVKNMSQIFRDCFKLCSLPDISRWNIAE